ncbi:monocarboxylate transporter 12-like [Saccoglossus kowalevskii]
MSVFLVEFREYFHDGAGKTALVASFMMGVRGFSAPLISILDNKFGSRPLIIIGGILSTIGLFMSSFVNNVTVLFLSYGVLSGIGFGFLYGPNVVIVGQYFHKHHVLANGVVFAGTATGLMAFPPLYHILIDTYGWRGAMIVMAGINMNIVVCGMLMRPPPTEDVYIRQTHRPESKSCGEEYLEETEYKQIIDDCETSDYELQEANEIQALLNGKISKPYINKLSDVLGLQLFKKSWFWILCISGTISGIGHNTAMMHTVSKAVSVGIAKLDAAFLMTIMGACSLIGRVMHGVFIDIGNISPVFITSCMVVKSTVVVVVAMVVVIYHIIYYYIDLTYYG